MLLIDDNPGDVDLLRIISRNQGLDLSLTVAEDGVRGQELLVAAEERGQPFRLILLDVNMPRLDGRQFLRWVRGRPASANSTILVWSSSHSPRDEAECLALGATDYVVKPADLGEFEALLHRFRDLLAAADDDRPRR